ncbi:MAG TPA: class I SAM-dependent methyltransferase [Ilumatobacter sp.]|nr:class I SAM-dependent methyltransferase [Ilumatobacter sp.]
MIPTDAAIQVNETFHINVVSKQLLAGAVVVDLGSGDGRGRRKWRRYAPQVSWIGVDIASSPEVELRPVSDAPLVTYDGIRLPFATASVDCISCQQVLEHVRHPEQVLAEAARVLKPGAPMIGTTSNLEPYHSYSLWNFTLYGFVTIAREAGLDVVEVRPGIDGPTLIERQIRNRPPEMSKYFSETSPRNAEIIEWGRQTKRNAALVNNRMLQFCGHFAFHTTRRPT